MKSLHKAYSRTSHEQLKTWEFSELDVELAVSDEDLQKEQILALFYPGGEDASSPRENGPRSTLHSAGTDLVLPKWQPGEMNWQPLQDVDKEWIFVQSSDSYQESQRKIWQEQPKSERARETRLKRAHAQAEEILLEARAAADRLILQAQDAIELEKKKGYQQGQDNARQEMQETLQAVHAVVEELRKWQADFMSQGEQTLIEMVKEIAQALFGEGVNLDSNVLQANLQRVMENAQRLGDLSIFLNPRDANLLDPSWKEYQLLIRGNKVRIIPSEKITPGGCLIKGNTGTVDARVETQLAAIMNTFDEMEMAER